MISQQQFVRFIAALAEPGETALLVQQKPVLSQDGKYARHPDGGLKSTWPSFLPKHKIATHQPWYMNTGSFVIERFTNKVPSASKNNCDYVLVMVLDDIGTKAKVPPLQPTWRLETSEGCEQWGYVFSEQPKRQEYAAAITAIARAGYSDEGSINPVRNFRIPGSLNLKPGRNNFVSRVLEFNPKVEYTLAKICRALDVKPDPIGGEGVQSIKIKDTLNDSVLQWLGDNSLVLSKINAEGWLGVVCPNHRQHTDGASEGRYKPQTRAYCCYHSHCLDLNSEAFLGWVQENGGPKVEYGLRSELLSQSMQEAIAKIPPTALYPDAATELAEKLKVKDASRLEKVEWYQRYAFVTTGEGFFFDFTTRDVLSKSSFDAMYEHVDCKSVKNSARSIAASKSFNETRKTMDSKILNNLTYAAGETEIIELNGKFYGNTWLNARPDVSQAPDLDISIWLDHCKTLVPNDIELEHIFDIMAFKLQNPIVKINHAILHVGAYGNGKDTMYEPFFWGVCGPGRTNLKVLDNKSLNSQWGYDYESEIFLINELKEPDAKERRVLANNLKPLIAAPPHTLTVNRKGLHPYTVPNRMFVMAFSNEDVPIVLDSKDRRWFCVKSLSPIMDTASAAKIWKWFSDGGREACVKWLYKRDVAKFNPGMKPPVTDFKLSLVEDGLNMTEAYLIDLIKARAREFSRGVIAAPFQSLCEQLSSSMPSSQRFPPAAIIHAIKEAGWIDCGRCASRTNPNPKQIYAAPEIFATYSKSQIRDEVEKPSKIIKLAAVK